MEKIQVAEAKMLNKRLCIDVGCMNLKLTKKQSTFTYYVPTDVQGSIAAILLIFA